MVKITVKTYPANVRNCRSRDFGGIDGRSMANVIQLIPMNIKMV